MRADDSGPVIATEKEGVLDERLLSLLADGDWHAGSALAARLGVSRTSVWKHIRRFERKGLLIERKHGRGYRLSVCFDPLDRQAITQAFHRLVGPTGRVLFEDVVGSTNDIARELIAESPLLVSANFQASGRGRRGRRWWSPYGAGLCLSLGFRLELPPDGITPLPLVCALGVTDALAASMGINVGIKWPNDIEIEGRKLGGILVEVQGESLGPLWTVVGIGVNVHRARTGYPSDLESRIIALDDLPMESHPRRSKVFLAILEALWARIQCFVAEGFVAMLHDYDRRDVIKGKAVVIQSEGIPPAVGTAQGIDAQGWLRVRTADGSERRFGTGEVSLRVA